MSFLKVEHVSTGYGKKQVIFDASFEMQKGETLLIIGSNGSGKSTLLKTIYGMLKPWGKEAKIWYNNQLITNIEPFQLIKKGIVYIPQQNELFEDLTVKENLEISGMQTINKHVLKVKIAMVLEQMAALKPLLWRKCCQLSGGERKLLSLSMALINQPQLIMFDEPFAGLSPKATYDIVSKIKWLKNVGISLIVIEHRLKDVFGLADRVIGIKLGRISEEKIYTIEEGMKKVMI